MSRLKEPSTWAGIGLILSAIAPALPLVYATPVGALIGVCGGIAYILREGKKEKYGALTCLNNYTKHDSKNWKMVTIC